jgi:hypothetical protein
MSQVAFTGYGNESKRQRRLMHLALGIQTVPKYNPLIEFETKAFLHRLLLNPKDYLANLRRYRIFLIFEIYLSNGFKGIQAG